MDSLQRDEWKSIEKEEISKLCNLYINRKDNILSLQDEGESTVKVLVTGIAADPKYITLLHFIAKGFMLGQQISVILSLLTESEHMPLLQNMVNQLKDCQTPLLENIIVSTDYKEAITKAKVAIMLPPDPPIKSLYGLLQYSDTIRQFREYGKIFHNIGANMKILVVAEPTLLNAQVLRRSCPGIPAHNITALSKEVLNIFKFQLSKKMLAKPSYIRNLIYWGFDKTKLTFDLSKGLFKDGEGWKDLASVIGNEHWVKNNLPLLIKQRLLYVGELGNYISVSKAICDQVYDCWHGLEDETWITMLGVESDDSYGIPKGVFAHLPVNIDKMGHHKIISDIEISPENQIKIQSMKEKLVDSVNFVQTNIFRNQFKMMP